MSSSASVLFFLLVLIVVFIVVDQWKGLRLSYISRLPLSKADFVIIDNECHLMPHRDKNVMPGLCHVYLKWRYIDI